MKKILLLAAACMAATSTMSALDIYVIGDNVNGQSWAMAAEDAKMTEKGNGIYEWDGEVLGTGFKFNDGTWSDDTHNWGSSGGQVENGVPYSLFADAGSGNIALFECTEVKKPHIVFDLNEATVTVTGDFGGQLKWYIAGTFEKNFVASEGGYELVETETEGVFKGDFVVVQEEGTMKITQTGWINQYGLNDPGETVIENNSKLLLEECGGEGGNVPYVLAPGTYTCTWDYNNLEMTISNGSGVEGIEVEENAPATYYNLQGVRVANPENGVYVKVAGGKATKVAL